jgi:NADPH:quinone reductase-like Zn-dependent oxidoreductase
VVGLDQVEPVFGVLDNVGGSLLARAFELLEPDGMIQSIGMASLEPTSIDFEQARLRGGGRIEAFNVFSHGGSLAKDLPPLLELAAQGQLDAQIGWRNNWINFDDAIKAFRGRHILGKAVLDITETSRKTYENF